MMTNSIASIVLICIVGAASIYIYKAKKKGAKCIGCPASGGCSCCKENCSDTQKEL